MNKELLIAVCKSGDGYEAYAPDYPGHLVTGRTIVEAIANISAKLKSRVEYLIDKNGELPDDKVFYGFIEVSVDNDNTKKETRRYQDYRKRRGLTQAALAAKLRVQRKTEPLGYEGRGLSGAVKFALESVG